MTSSAVAVIGAGMAGVACAGVLSDAGVPVALFEKSRGLGGRLATRRVGRWSFDHGAQYVTAKGSAFRGFLRRQPAAKRWRPAGMDHAAAWYVGVPTQSALVGAPPDAAALHLNTRIAAIERHPSGAWTAVTDDERALAPFAAVAVAVPAPQVLELLGQHGSFDPVAGVSLLPCWAVMLATDTPLELADVLREPHPDIAWVAANHSKPERMAEQGQYVIHASAAWSATNLEAGPADAAQLLLARFRELVGSRVEPLYCAAHRWRYALVDNALGEPCLFDPELALGAAGDWCLGGRVEAAFMSGVALGERIAAWLRP